MCDYLASFSSLIYHICAVYALIVSFCRWSMYIMHLLFFLFTNTPFFSSLSNNNIFLTPFKYGKDSRAIKDLCQLNLEAEPELELVYISSQVKLEI